MFVGFIAEYGSSDAENKSTCWFVDDLTVAIRGVKSKSSKPKPVSFTQGATRGSPRKKKVGEPKATVLEVQNLQEWAEKVTRENSALKHVLRKHNIDFDLGEE